MFSPYVMSPRGWLFYHARLPFKVPVGKGNEGLTVGLLAAGNREFL